eukprot:2950425-Pleurochrysis_carterae.AAC.2
MPHAVCRTFACCTLAGRLHAACASGMAFACRVRTCRAFLHAARHRMPHVLTCRACLRAARAFMLLALAHRAIGCPALVWYVHACRMCACRT